MTVAMTKGPVSSIPIKSFSLVTAPALEAALENLKIHYAVQIFTRRNKDGAIHPAMEITGPLRTTQLRN